ncbi:hypothetical protein M8C21_025529 [Ambrosia artemisiifolia]|uniref:F-box domain-containing protein n=1 Tax=Ambrosia artemisiifolia TaxID=4212 RepID=A0AAD5CLE0_AMBAR|nr:hypothetical protein M8C21_025529 [Ambrosia artemisiifolia]
MVMGRRWFLVERGGQMEMGLYPVASPLVNTVKASNDCEGRNQMKRLKEDWLLLLREFNFVSSSLSQLLNNLDNALQVKTHKRRFVTSSAAADDDDIITNFPEDLIIPILERLPIEDAIRTSVLSKNWRYRWTTIRTLDFSRQFTEKLSKNGAFSHNGFIRVINKIMIHHQGPIEKFVIHIPKEIALDSFQEVDQWMLLLSRKSVNELVIIKFNWVYQIPSSVFSCVELRLLVLYNCIFKTPLEFQGFPNLQEIILKKVTFEDSLRQIMINLPQLKTLGLEECVNVNNFNIKAENVQRLRVVSCPDAILLRLLHSERLKEVIICLSKPMKDFLQVGRFNLVRMLSKLPNLVTFTIDGYFLKATRKFPDSLPQAIKRLQRLRFQSLSFGDLDLLQSALCMLRNSTNLKVLRVTHMPMGSEADLDIASNHLESPECPDQKLSNLKKVEITSLEGSRPELLFIKLLLDHSPHLEKMIIRPSATVDAEKRCNIAKDVMLFPRASTKAKMVFLDP